MTRANGRVAIALLVTIALLVGATGVAAAQSARTGGTIVVERGETVGDLQATGGSVVIRGTVEGDVEALAGSVVVEESGRVAGNVQAAAGSVTVLGTVEGDVEASAGSVTVGSGAVVGGDLQVAAGSLLLAGTVDGTVEAAVERLQLASTASVGGDVKHGTQTEVVREDGASVGGSVTAVEDLSVEAGPGDFGAPDLGPSNLVFGIYGALVTLLLGAVLLLAFPGFTGEVVAEVRDRPLRSSGIGLGGLVGIPLALLALVITVVGIPLTLLGFMAFGVLVFVSAALAEYAVGTWALSAAGVDNRWAGLVVGVLGVALLSRIPVVGWLVNLVVFLLGFGAVLTLLYRGYRRHRGSADGATGRTSPL